MGDGAGPGGTVYMDFIDATRFGAALVFEGLRDAPDERLRGLGFRRRPPSMDEAGTLEFAAQFAAITASAQTGVLPAWPIEALVDKARQMYAFHHLAPIYASPPQATRWWTCKPIPIAFCREFGTGTFAFMLLQRLRSLLVRDPTWGGQYSWGHEGGRS